MSDAKPSTEQAPLTAATANRGVRIALFVLLSLAAVLLLVSRAGAEEVSGIAPYLGATLALYLAPLFVGPRQDIFSPAAFMGLKEASRLLPAGVTLLVYGDSGLQPFNHLSVEGRVALMRSVCLMLSVAQLSYLLGFYASKGRAVMRVLPNLAGRPWRAPRFVLVLLVLLVLFLLSYAQFQDRAGGALFDLTNLAEGKRVWRDDASLSWMLRGVELGFLPVILLGAVAFSGGSRGYTVLTLALYVVMALLITRMGQRGPAMGCLLMLLMLFHYLKRRIPLALCAGVFLVLVAGSTVLGEYRSGATPAAPLIDRIASPSSTLASYTAERQHMAVYAAVMHFFPDQIEHLGGESWAGVLVSFVPRWLWPEKVDFAPWRETRVAYNLISVPAPTPYPGLLYANFSWPGVCLGMYFLGWLHRGLEEWRKRAPSDPNTVLLYVLLLTLFSPTAWGLSTLLQYLAPTLVALYFMMQRRQTAASSIFQPSSTAQPV